jgi:subtilisin-like proprotein convertase family protein
MFTRHHHRVLRRGSSRLRNKKGRGDQGLSRRMHWVERLEERYMLSATPPYSSLVIGAAAPPPTFQQQAQSQVASAASLLPVAPFPLTQTFQLHSDPGATKTIYLDFDGFTARNTPWNTLTGLPNIVTQPYDVDGDVTTFSDAEKLQMQYAWERVSEDYRPFDVDVTTQDPGVEALQNTGQGDQQWGIRVVIGGSTLDWFTPTTGALVGGVAYVGSFSWDTDVPCYVFGGDFGGIDKYIAEAVSHEVGHTVGLEHDGQYRFYYDSMTMSFKRVTLPYYPGHVDPPNGAPTGWAPIMGVGYDQPVTQWSKGEYFNANNTEDDLAIISDLQTNGFGYRIDDHGSTRATADPVVDDSATTSASVGTFSADGIIEQNTDVDYFSFTVEGLGEVVSLDVTPFQTGPNLDVLAKLYGPSGNLIATSNPVDDLLAGAQTYDPTIPDSGWIDANGQQLKPEFVLGPGTYYISVEGTDRPIQFVDPAAHPGPIIDDPTVPDLSDWGYTKYASLGYYKITGTRTKELVVGVDFDVAGGLSPTNWNLYTGGGPDDTLKNLVSEAGTAVPYQLEISTNGQSIDTFASANPIDPLDIPAHTPALDALDGFIAAENETLTFKWSNLAASTVYQIYVFGHDDIDAGNAVTVTGGQWNGVQQVLNFTQDVAADSLVVNDNAPGNQDLSTLSIFVVSDENGQITINVTNQDGLEAGIGGIAIAPTKVGSISGEKWNDVNGNQIKDSNEAGLPGWTIYLDLNNNGQLDLVSSPDQVITQASTDIPQAIPDNSLTGVKSALDFAGVGLVKDVNVTLDITHTYDADMDVYLVSPLGTRVKLFANVGLSGDNFHNTVLDDQATVGISSASATAPFTGTYKPEEPLSTFNNESAFGQWKLELADDAVGDVGVLNSWSLTITLQGVTTYLEPSQVTDASGNYTFAAVPPGLYHVREYISPAQVLAGWAQTWAPAPVTVRSGANVKNVDFGNWIPVAKRGSIQGQKYYDANQNGVKDAEDAGLPGWIVYIDSNNNGVRDIASTPTVIASTDVPKPITDFNTTTSQVTVNSIGTVFNIEVTLDITHTFVGDLDAYLVSPSGRQVKLFTNVGGQYNDFHNLTLSDNAARSISTIGVNDVPYTGTWKPEGTLSDFAGDDAAGIWTLVVSDTAFADEGTLNSWSLSITSGELFRTTDSNGNYEFDNLLPGQYPLREEAQPGWVQVPPSDTDIPAATWSNSHWDVTLVGVDNFNDPVPDSHRNVKNVDFGNYAPPGSIAGYVYRDLDASATKASTEPGLPGWTVFVDANNNGTLDTGIVDSTVSSDTAQAINNFFVVSSQLTFSPRTSISDVDVTLDISHTYDADLTAYLISPTGTRVQLFSHVGGSGDDFSDTTFDDSALQSITAGSAPFDDVFKPAEPLSAFNGENASGVWTLEITDSSAADDGSLNGWSLSIKGDELSTVTDAQGHYSFANLPPGTYYLDTVQFPDWTKTQTAGPVALLPSQALLSANIGERPPYLQGDFNSDGVVDAADFLVWRRQAGTTVPAFSGADADGDGDVDQDDLSLWRHNFGHYRDDHGNDAATATSLTLPAARGGFIEVPGDVDWFSFTATAGTEYKIKATLGTLDAGNLQLFGTDGTTQLATNSDATPLIDWIAPADGVYYAQVKGLNGSSVGTYTVGVSAVIIDDHGNDAATSTAIAVPSSTAGNIEVSGDVDWFNFHATTGNSYNISVFLGTLPYATLRVIGTDGVTELQFNAGFGPSLQWTPSSSGTYYLEVSGLSTTGTYTLSIAIDDHGNVAGTATPIAVPSTTAGVIEVPYDVDVFSFVATSGTSYRFRTTLNSLSDSTLTLIDKNGTTQLAFDDDGGGGLSSLIDWTAPSGGTYFVQVAGFTSAYGSYNLVASITSPGSGSGALLASVASGLTADSAGAPLQSSALQVSTVGPQSTSLQVVTAGGDASFMLIGLALSTQETTGGATQDGTGSATSTTSGTAAQNDLALLAWLADSSDGNQVRADSSMTDDVSASQLCDEPETVDVAFELLEGNALATAAI